MRAHSAYQGVECYVGMPGSGKTYALVEKGVHALRAGMRVFCNAGFAINDAESGRSSEAYMSLEELLTVPNGSLILLDEAPVFVNSRKSNEFPRGLLYRLTQVRKDALQFAYSAMDEMMVDVNLRRVTYTTWHCRRLVFSIFKRSALPPIDRRKGPEDDRVSARRWMFGLRDDIANAYDTTSKVYIPPEVIETLISDRVKPWLPLTNKIVEALWAGRERLRAEGELAGLEAMDDFLARIDERYGAKPGHEGAEGDAPARHPQPVQHRPLELAGAILEEWADD